MTPGAPEWQTRLAEAQRTTQHLIEALPVPVFFKGRNGRYLGVNAAWEAFFGIARDHFIGKTVHALYPHDQATADWLHAMDEALWRNPGMQTYERTITTADGRRHETIYYKATFDHADGSIAGLIGTIIDVTERREFERRYREMFEQAAVGITRVDLDGLLTDCNQRFCDMLGYARQELIGRHVRDITHPEDYRVGEQHRAAIRAGSTRSFADDKRLIRKDGSVLWARRTASAATDESGLPRYLISVVQDISQRKRAEDALERREAELRATNERLEMLIESSPLAIYTRDVNGRVTSWNPAAEKMYGWSAAEMLGQRLPTVPDEARADSDAVRMRLLAGEPPCNMEVERRRRDGTRLSIDAFVAQLRDPAGKVTGIITMAADITDRKRAERLRGMEHAVARVLAESRALADAIPEIIRIICETMQWQCGARWGLDEDANLLSCREYWAADIAEVRAFAEASVHRPLIPGVAKDGLVRRVYGSGSSVWLSDIARDEGFRRRAAAEKAGLRSAFAFPVSNAGEVLGVMEFFSREAQQPDDMVLQAVQSVGRQIGQYVGRIRAEQTLKFVASHDSLTGLPNRAMFAQRLSQAVAHARRHGCQLAVLFVDLDRFKVINDSLGHDTGDALLRETARRMTATVRRTDTVARPGGDEFVVLLEDVGSPALVADVAQKLRAALGRPAAIGSGEFDVTVSVGISLYPRDGDDPQTLLKNADIAMYRAKEQGRNSVRTYSAHMSVHSAERLTLESELRRALSRGELALYYQPQVDVRTGAITAFEALVRWPHPRLGLVRPSRFIPLAEESGLIVAIGEWVLATATDVLERWRRRGLAQLRMAVNLSARQLVHGDLMKCISRLLRQAQCDPKNLDLEITESMVMQNPEHAVTVLDQLKAMGTRVTIDDFGTGYSSLAYLTRFPVDSLKIDRSFIAKAATEPRSAAIVQAVIAMARSLHLGVIAEGVESSEQMAFLLAQGCHDMQGYYFSRPVSEDAAAALVEAGPPQFRHLCECRNPLPAIALPDLPSRKPRAAKRAGTTRSRLASATRNRS